MKINEVEALVGITRKNIRFYESEGLLTPCRSSNGYRDYSDSEVDVLRRIKLLRKLGVPLEEIRRLQGGELTLDDAMRRHLITLEREQKNLADAARLCGQLADRGQALEQLDPQDWLTQMEQMEQEGTTFMNKQKQDKKRYIAPIIAAGVMVLLMVWVIGTLLWSAAEDPIPRLMLAGLLLIPAAVIIGVVVALVQRIRELGKNELDDAGKY